jgi:hypothetical protein
MRPSLWLSAHKSVSRFSVLLCWSGRQPRVPVVVAVLTIFYVKRLTNEPLHYLLFLSSPSSWQVSVTCSRFSLPPCSATNNNNSNNQEDQRHKRDKTLVDTAMTPSDCYSSRFFQSFVCFGRFPVPSTLASFTFSSFSCRLHRPFFSGGEQQKIKIKREEEETTSY